MRSFARSVFRSLLAAACMAAGVTPVQAADQDGGNATMVYRIPQGQVQLAQSCSPAEGKDFTWCVPVNVTDLPDEVTDVVVQCKALSANRAQTVALSTARASVQNNQYEGTLTVSATAEQGHQPREAKRWACRLLLESVNRPGSRFASQNCSRAIDQQNDFACVRPNTEASLTVRGDY